jgi:hypothetical protein
MRIEQIVRPFQVVGGRRVVSTITLREVREAGAEWGAVGMLPTPYASPEPGPMPPINFIVKGLNQKNVQQPAKNELERVKVIQEGNPDNFVIVERLKKATFKDPKPRYLTSPEQPIGGAGANAKVPVGPTNFKPGPGDPEETPMPNSMGTETVAPPGWQGTEVKMQGPRGEALAYNAKINAALAAKSVPPAIKFDTHEYEFNYGPPGPNEIPVP